VSRQGAMALSWSMDKLGPICRTVEDCAAVFAAIRGPDGLDPAVIDRPFNWPLGAEARSLKVGFVQSAFEHDRGDEQAQWRQSDLNTLQVLRELGFDLVPIELPEFPTSAMAFILSAEAAAAFDELTRSGRDDLLVRQVKNAWPNTFRQARLIPAVEYVQANRARTLLMRQMAEATSGVDVYVCPSFVGSNLLLTNLTGHPCVVLPNGFRDNGTPTSITFNGKLFGETELLAVAAAYQGATEHHLRRPGGFE